MKTPPAATFFRKAITGALFSAFTLGAGLSAANASITLFPPDSLSSDWTTSRYGNPLVETITLQEEEWLRISRTASNNGSAQIMYSGEGNTLSDFTGSVILGTHATSGYGTGVILRSAGTNFTNANSYFLAVVPNSSGTSTLGLYYGGSESFIPPQANSSWTTLDTVTLSSRIGGLSSTNNNQYLLEFSFIGDQLEATLSIWDTVTNSKGDELGSLSYTETDLTRSTSGYFGVRGGRYGGNVDSYFRAVEVQAVPEPATAAMVGLAAGGLLIYRRISRK